MRSTTASTAASPAGPGAFGLSPAALATSFGPLARFGSEVPAPQRDAIVEPLRQYLAAIIAGRWRAACGWLSAPVQRSLIRLAGLTRNAHSSACPALLGTLLGRVSVTVRAMSEPVAVLAVRAKRARSFVLFRTSGAGNVYMSMARAAGGWKAGQLGPSQPAG